MKCFGWTPDYIRKRITGAQGWAYYSWATAEACGEYMSSPPVPENGWTTQERDRIKRLKK